MRVSKCVLAMIALGLGFLLAGCGGSHSGSTSPTITTTDYSQASNWLSTPATNDKPVDVFYLYPTAWLNVDLSAPHVCSIDEPSMHIGAPKAFARQATAFEPVGNIYAPYYRQNNLSPVDREETVAGIPTADATAAFDYYIKHYNKGRPFILVGHSQGADVLRFMLSSYMKANPSVYKRMIVAYVIGVSVTPDYLVANRHLKFAQGAYDTGVIVSYNTQAPDLADGANPVTVTGSLGPGLVINPINWRRDETPAPASQSLGSYMPDPQTGVYSQVMDYADATIDREKGVLICSTVDEDAMYALSPVRGVYHSFDYPFYYYNLRKNAADRVSRYLSSHS